MCADPICTCCHRVALLEAGLQDALLGLTRAREREAEHDPTDESMGITLALNRHINTVQIALKGQHDHATEEREPNEWQALIDMADGSTVAHNPDAPKGQATQPTGNPESFSSGEAKQREGSSKGQSLD